ncbi:MAG: type pilus assembly protein PilB [Patescibacteria group bacterium]|jgi:type IV pilus assembly protein PilB|nr:type pilus assembly protein PilB [Patescibacteria group bacterium]
MSFVKELVDQGLISDTKLQSLMKIADEKYGGDIYQAIYKETDLNQEAILDLKSKYFGIPKFSLGGQKLDSSLLNFIPEESVVQYKIAPIGFSDSVLNVGIVDPSNTRAVDALQFISSKNGTPFKLFVISDADFAAVIENYKGLGGEVDSALSDLDSELTKADESLNKKENETEIDKKKIVEEAPIIKVVAVILRHAVEGRASDIHIESTGEKVKVRFRVDGELHTSLTLPTKVYSGVVARIKILAKLRLDEKRKPQDGGFSAKVNGRKVDFRVSTFPAYYGEKVVMRILDTEKGIKTLEDLNLREEHYDMIKEALNAPYGIILITGPTGSGKTTTLYAMLNALDKEGKNVVSLEDPVEYVVDGVSQSQVMPEIGYTFASGLRSILRQDPDVILVGEIRDKETAKLAIQAALTGHLVLSTLHTNNAAGVIPRLIDMEVDPYLIAPTLRLAMAQRLAKATCEDAKKEVPLDEPTKAMLSEQFKDLPEQYKSKLNIKNTMLQTVPSKTCPSGTRGRAAVFEMFPIDKDIEKIILENPTELGIQKMIREKGMLSMKEDAILKSLRGDIPMQEVYNF